MRKAEQKQTADLLEWEKQFHSLLPTLRIERADITKLRVDAIVNPADGRIRGEGGGLDVSLHKAGGPAVFNDCLSRFPNGMLTGDAGWTTAGALKAKWLIHTVGPKYHSNSPLATTVDRQILASCYRRSLQVADSLGAQSIAFPLISAGRLGWPTRDAIRVALETIDQTPHLVKEVKLVASNRNIYDQMLGAFEELFAGEYRIVA